MSPAWRAGLSRAHFWLSLVVGVQMLIWVATGLFFAAVPIETVRGEHLRAPAEPPALILSAPLIAPEIAAAEGGFGTVAEIALRPVAGRPTYLVSDGAGTRRLVDAQTGAVRAEVTPAEAEAIARALYAGRGALQGLERLSEAPAEFGRPGPVYLARFGPEDAARVYVAAETGEARTIRTDLWRLYDFLWGLHIMDYQARENFNHALLITFAAGALAMAGTGLALTANRALRPRRRRAGGPTARDAAS